MTPSRQRLCASGKLKQQLNGNVLLSQSAALLQSRSAIHAVHIYWVLVLGVV